MSAGNGRPGRNDPLLSDVSPRMPGPAGWAVRAMWREVAGFRFDYPLETIAESGPRESLHYYLHSDRLFFDAMILGPDEVPRHVGRLLGQIYNPAYVAWYGLTRHERHLRGVDPCGREAFLRQVEWLADQAVRRRDGSVVWFLPQDWQEGDCFLKAPWISAMSQGLAMSALVRGYRINGEKRLLDICRDATLVFDRDIAEGGVRTKEGNSALYEEYPGYPLPRVLDGFLFGLLGLYDVFVETGDAAVGTSFASGIAGLKATLPFWNYRDKWSWYGSHGYLCPPHYNRLNAALLESLSRLSNEPVLAAYARSWDPRRLGLLGRVEIYLMFQVTKNRCRLKNLRKAAGR